MYRFLSFMFLIIKINSNKIIVPLSNNREIHINIKNTNQDIYEIKKALLLAYQENAQQYDNNSLQKILKKMDNLIEEFNQEIFKQICLEVITSPNLPEIQYIEIIDNSKDNQNQYYSLIHNLYNNFSFEIIFNMDSTYNDILIFKKNLLQLLEKQNIKIKKENEEYVLINNLNTSLEIIKTNIKTDLPYIENAIEGFIELDNLIHDKNLSKKMNQYDEIIFKKIITNLIEDLGSIRELGLLKKSDKLIQYKNLETNSFSRKELDITYRKKINFKKINNNKSYAKLEYLMKNNISIEILFQDESEINKAIKILYNELDSKEDLLNLIETMYIKKISAPEDFKENLLKIKNLPKKLKLLIKVIKNDNGFIETLLNISKNIDENKNIENFLKNINKTQLTELKATILNIEEEINRREKLKKLKLNKIKLLLKKIFKTNHIDIKKDLDHNDIKLTIINTEIKDNNANNSNNTVINSDNFTDSYNFDTVSDTSFNTNLTDISISDTSENNTTINPHINKTCTNRANIYEIKTNKHLIIIMLIIIVLIIILIFKSVNYIKHKKN